MNIQQLLAEYDALFADHSIPEIEAFLLSCIGQARQEHDDSARLSLCNELMGLCRETGNLSLGMQCITEIEQLCRSLSLQGEVYGTTLLNIANACRVFGLLEKSARLYPQVEAIYRENLPHQAFAFAGLYNNWSLLRQAEGNTEEAAALLRKALQITALYPEAALKTATSQVNLANVLLQLPACAQQQAEIHELLTQALAAFEADGGRDYHYSAALAAMGSALYQTGQYEESARYYAHAMQELESHIGKTGAWESLSLNYQEALRQAKAGK